jgi:hypothetical protein
MLQYIVEGGLLDYGMIIIQILSVWVFWRIKIDICKVMYTDYFPIQVYNRWIL